MSVYLSSQLILKVMRGSFVYCEIFIVTGVQLGAFGRRVGSLVKEAIASLLRQH